MSDNGNKTLKAWALRRIKDEGEREDFLYYCKKELGYLPNYELSYLDFEEIYTKGFN